MPTLGNGEDLKNINFDVIRYYLAKGQKPSEPGMKCLTM